MTNNNGYGYGDAVIRNFLGQAPTWYKSTILVFLLVNPIILYILGPFITGWILILEFIFTLALALKCYPLQPCLLYTSDAADE